MAEKLPRFGASDFYLTETDPVVIRENLRAALADVLGRDVVDSDPHMVLASAFMPYIVQGLASIDACAKATLRAYAVGADLDRIADSTCIVGYLDRKPSSPAILPAIVQFTLTRDSALSASDVVVSWSGAREFDVDGETVRFSGAGDFVVHFEALDGSSKNFATPLYLRCEKVGPAYNAIGADLRYVVEDQALTDDMTLEAVEAPSSDTGQSFSVSSVSASLSGETYGGADAESDADFSQRVAWQAKALRVPGSLEYFKLALSSVQTLTSAYISPVLDSDGRIVLAWADKPSLIAEMGMLQLTERGDAYNEFLRTVQTSLLVEQHAYAYMARLYNYSASITVSYKLPQNTADVGSASALVRSAFNAWKTRCAWHCGAVVRDSDAIAAVASAGAVDVSVSSVMSPDGPLPADAIMMADQFSLVYDGLSTDYAPASGGAGEDITPV